MSNNDYLENANFDMPLEKDINLSLSYEIFKKHIKPEILNLLSIHTDKNSFITLTSVILKKFKDELENVHLNIFSDKSDLLKEIFLVYQICRCFYYYNLELQLTYNEFRARILYPNIIYMLIRFFPRANMFFRTLISNVFFEIKKQSYGIIQKHTNAYHLDENIIKTDILYEFIGNTFKKFNPLKIDKLNKFYKQVFRNIYYYYFKKAQPDVSYHSILNIESENKSFIKLPIRSLIYKNVLYKLQIEKYCRNSQILSQINYNYNIFKNVIISNELQNMYFNKSYAQLTSNPQLQVIKIYKDLTSDETKLKQIMELPMIYKLLKCVHIINPKAKPYNDKVIKPLTIKTVVLEELLFYYGKTFSESHVYNILEKISKNFTDNLLSGEYLNLITLNMVKIEQVFSFITQLRKFIKLCLEDD